MDYISLPSWTDGSWNVATVDNKVIPGLVNVEPSRGVKYDKKEAPGQTGGKATFKGYELADVKITVRLWTPEQEADFSANILPLLDPQPGKESPKGYPFIHPGTAERKIDGILVEKLTGPKVDDEGRFKEYSVDAFEYRKPVPQQGKPGKGGSSCAELKAAYEQSVAILNIAIVEWNNLLINLAPADQIEASNQRMILAQNDVTYCSQALADNKCSEASAGSDAAAGDVPAP